MIYEKKLAISSISLAVYNETGKGGGCRGEDKETPQSVTQDAHPANAAPCGHNYNNQNEKFRLF